MPATAMALQPLAADAAGDFLLIGWVRDDTWAWTQGATLYADTTTAGGMTETIPSGSGDQVQLVGQAMATNTVYFKPGLELVEIA
jgi:hypothetical protein